MRGVQFYKRNQAKQNSEILKILLKNYLRRIRYFCIQNSKNPDPHKDFNFHWCNSPTWHQILKPIRMSVTIFITFASRYIHNLHTKTVWRKLKDTFDYQPVPPHQSTVRAWLAGDGLATLRARLARGGFRGQFYKRNPFKRNLWKSFFYSKRWGEFNFTKEIKPNKILKSSKCCSKITHGGSDTFAYKIQKIQISVGILIFVGAILQLVKNIKLIRQLFCTFSSCNVLGIYMIYNTCIYIGIFGYIYEFQEK